jgi:mycothiol synthase
LIVDGQPVGVIAVRAEAAPDGGMPARLALAPDARSPGYAGLLVDGVVDLVRRAGGSLARVFALGGSGWLVPALESVGFERVRTIAHMLLPAEATTPAVRPSEDWRLRPMLPGEDGDVLAALNRNWTGTWNFVEITPEMLRADLDGQRDGMLLGVTDTDRIIATCHAVYDQRTQNPDGAPHAWISNLTVDPEFRGRGVARAMLGAGIAHLRNRGATSVTLGVDADDPAPFRLYQSVGFQIASRLDAWDAAV